MLDTPEGPIVITGEAVRGQITSIWVRLNPDKTAALEDPRPYRLSHRTTAAPCGALRRRKVLNNPILGLPTERRDLSAVRGRDTFRLCRRARLAAGGQPGATTPATLTCSAASQPLVRGAKPDDLLAASRTPGTTVRRAKSAVYG